MYMYARGSHGECAWRDISLKVMNVVEIQYVWGPTWQAFSQSELTLEEASALHHHAFLVWVHRFMTCQTQGRFIKFLGEGKNVERERCRDSLNVASCGTSPQRVALWERRNVHIGPESFNTWNWPRSWCIWKVQWNRWNYQAPSRYGTAPMPRLAGSMHSVPTFI
jgi:hypothetical protein